MRIVIQRVTEASVTIDGEVRSAIGQGLMILLGIETDDTVEDAEWLVKKVASIRLFDDAQGVMNLDVTQAGGQAMVVSQFTLHASTKKGNRPSYIHAARPELAIPLYEKFVALLESALGKPVATGVFGADMKVALVNDGPVTIIIDSKRRE